MKKNKQQSFWLAGMFIAYIIMITGIITLSNQLLNNVSIFDTDSLHPVLFIPARYSFSIWGLIYIGLVIWLIAISLNIRFFNQMCASLFILSCIWNILWLILWQYHHIRSAVVISGVLLLSLFLLYLNERYRNYFTIVFSLYLGWITVVFLTNVSYYLVAVHHISIAVQMTTSLIFLFIGLGVGATMLYFFKDRFYNLALIWAYIGIFIHNYTLNATVAISALIFAITLFILTILSYFKRLQLKDRYNKTDENKTL